MGIVTLGLGAAPLGAEERVAGGLAEPAAQRALAVAQVGRGAGRLLALDRFNRADSVAGLGSAETGQVWTYQSNASTAAVYGILGGQAYCVSAGGNDHLALLDVGVADGITISYDVTMLAGASFIGMICRYLDSNNYLGWRVQQSGGVTSMFRNLAGARTAPGPQNPALTMFGGIPYHFDFYVEGASLELVMNGRVLWGGSDPNFLGSTKVGILVGNVVGAPPLFENFRVELGRAGP